MMHTEVNGLELLHQLYEEVEVACNSVARENELSVDNAIQEI